MTDRAPSLPAGKGASPVVVNLCSIPICGVVHGRCQLRTRDGPSCPAVFSEREGRRPPLPHNKPTQMAFSFGGSTQESKTSPWNLLVRLGPVRSALVRPGPPWSALVSRLHRIYPARPSRYTFFLFFILSWVQLQGIDSSHCGMAAWHHGSNRRPAPPEPLNLIPMCPLVGVPSSQLYFCFSGARLGAQALRRSGEGKGGWRVRNPRGGHAGHAPEDSQLIQPSAHTFVGVLELCTRFFCGRIQYAVISTHLFLLIYLSKTCKSGFRRALTSFNPYCIHTTTRYGLTGEFGEIRAFF